MGGAVGRRHSLADPAPEIRNVIIACDPDPLGIMAARDAARTMAR